MSAPTINANAAIFFRILLMIGSFSFALSSPSIKPKQSEISATLYLLKQLNNNCSQVGSIGHMSTT
jgi:hypothetical protein